jgi:hypothetical protein
MAVPDEQDVAQQLFKGSYLSYLVPFATNFHVEQAVAKRGHELCQTVLDAVEQRDVLFFGMRFAHWLFCATSCCLSAVAR